MSATAPLRRSNAFTVLMRIVLIGAGVLAVASGVIAQAAQEQPLDEGVIIGRISTAEGPTAIAAMRDVEASGTIPTPATPTPGDLIQLSVALLWVYTGTAILIRRRRNLSGWLFLAVGFGWVIAAFASALVVWAIHTDTALPFRDGLAVMYENAFWPVALLPVMFLLFPDGKPPSPRWRWVEWANLGAAGVVLVAFTLAPGPLNNLVPYGIVYENPIGVAALDGISPAAQALAVITLLGCSLATVVGVTLRFRRATEAERLQLRWLVRVALVAGTLLVVLIVSGIVASTITPEDSLDETGVSGAIDFLFIVLVFVIGFGIPGAYLIAIFRHGLWDLGLVIRKAAVALVLTLVIVVPTVLVIAIATQFLMWNGTPRPMGLFGGVLIGLALWPLIHWERKIARRITFGRRASSYEALSAFGDRIAETSSTDDVLPQLADVLRDAVGADTAGVWLLLEGVLREEAAAPSTVGGPYRREVKLDGASAPTVEGEGLVEVRHQGELLGALSVRLPASDPMDAQKSRLMHDLASQAGPVLRNVQLIEALRDSRRRIVAAGDERAKQLERNIHDGVQQQLVALSVKLRLADAMVDKDGDKAHSVLKALQADATTALEDLRDLARGIYPPLLADQGLVAALEAQARKAAVPTIVETDGLGRYDQAIESATYFCVLEALNNVAKYANAASATICLAQTDGHLSFSVTDDGNGFDTAQTSYGTGLQGMADRLDAIGGRLQLTSTPGQGTTVTGRLPAGGGST